MWCSTLRPEQYLESSGKTLRELFLIYWDVNERGREEEREGGREEEREGGRQGNREGRMEGVMNRGKE